MIEEQVVIERPEAVPTPLISQARRLEFDKNRAFQNELRRRVDAHFEATGDRRRDCTQMYVKSAILLTSFAVTYIALVFFATTWWTATPLAVLLGLLTACIGFNLQHDGAHRSYSAKPWISRLMAMALDMIGGSSYYWRWSHVVFHHTYANIDGYDNDISVGILGRFTPHQKKLAVHRYQHIYMWLLYGLMAVKWQLTDDFRDYIRGKQGDHVVPRPKGLDLAEFIFGKLLFVTLAFVLPLAVGHSWVAVLVFYGVTVGVLGNVLSVVFQLAHCVGEAAFPRPNPDTLAMESAWAVHQVETTVDFARGNRVVSWFLGGLNFQIEHHLFPLVSHVNYPAIAPIVEATCREYGIAYNEHRGFWSGVASHFRWLRQLGREEQTPPLRPTLA